MNRRILIVEDDSEILDLLIIALEKQGYNALGCQNGMDALRQFEQNPPDLVLLDIQLPDMDGFQICRHIRNVSNIPIIFISCLSDGSDVILGLELGADDYVTKPFDLYQLFARIKANLRRAPIFNRGAFPTVSLDPQNKLQQPNSETQRLHFGDLEIDLIYQRAVVRGKTLALSYKEFSVLSLLAQKVNQIIREDELHHWIWGTESNGDTRTLRVHISNLRKKLEAYPHLPSYIRNIRGQGYQFVWES